LANFKEFIKEGKQVGNIYHFTKVEALNHLISDEKQKEYGLEVFEFFARNDRFSCTRDGCLAHNILSKDINVSKGYTVRIDFDGNKISNNFKIRPINGYINDEDNGKRIGKEYQEKEEVISMKQNLVAQGKTFKAIKYIKGIVFQNNILNNPEFDKEFIESELNKLKIPFRYVRKYNELHKLDEKTSVDTSYHTHEIILKGE
jgi:hypothetical protein